MNSIVEDVFVLTTSFNINLIRPANQGILKSIGTVRHRSRDQFTATSCLFNEEGKEIAFGSGNFVKSKVVLDENIGYK